MKYFLVCFLLYVYAISLQSQKPIIDSLAVAEWPSLGYTPIISNDGKYFLYTVENLPVGGVH